MSDIYIDSSRFQYNRINGKGEKWHHQQKLTWTSQVPMEETAKVIKWHHQQQLGWTLQVPMEEIVNWRKWRCQQLSPTPQVPMKEKTEVRKWRHPRQWVGRILQVFMEEIAEVKNAIICDKDWVKHHKCQWKIRQKWVTNEKKYTKKKESNYLLTFYVFLAQQ